jgi:hypothetical protein
VHKRPAQGVERPRPPAADATPGSSPEYRLVGQVLAIVVVLALSFLMELTLLGYVRHDRDQIQLAVKGQFDFPLGGQLISLLADSLCPCPRSVDLPLI